VTAWHDWGIPLARIGDYVGHTGKYMTSHYRHLLEEHAERDRALMDAALARMGDARLETRTRDAALEAAS
jgi:hypothetical protein